jgi:hypothetical protein
MLHGLMSTPQGMCSVISPSAKAQFSRSFLSAGQTVDYISGATTAFRAISKSNPNSARVCGARRQHCHIATPKLRRCVCCSCRPRLFLWRITTPPRQLPPRHSISFIQYHLAHRCNGVHAIGSQYLHKCIVGGPPVDRRQLPLHHATPCHTMSCTLLYNGSSTTPHVDP